MPHRHSWIFALVLLVLPRIAFAGSPEEGPRVTYRSATSEVRVVFFTTDDRNRPVDAVNPDDFVIVDGERVVRDFRSLSHSDETTLDVLVMVNASESVANRFQPVIHDVLQLVAQKQVAEDDNLSVASFANLRTELLCTRDCRSAGAGKKLLSVKALGATPLYDALAYSADFISNRHVAGVRPIVVLFSDGDDNVSRTSGTAAVQAVIASGALLYTIDVNPRGNGGRGSSNLRRLAEATGGRYFSSREDAANVLASALEDLRNSYVVTYKLPAQEGGFHSLRILPKHNSNLRFHCRSGYYYGNNIP